MGTEWEYPTPNWDRDRYKIIAQSGIRDGYNVGERDGGYHNRPCPALPRCHAVSCITFATSVQYK